MNLGVFGAGYVGLVTGTCFSEMGNQVVVCDIDPDRIARLQAGEVPIYEPGLEELIERNVAEGRLSFTTDPAETVERSEILFIAVGTPPDEDGSADVSRVLEVARTIARLADGPRIIVNKSTAPVGTSDLVQTELARTSEHPCTVAVNPEFLKEGSAVDDFMKPDRIVVGTEDPAARARLEDLYSPFVRTGKPILLMDPRSAEMTKYAANAMLATRITFMNEIANLCERVGANVDQVRTGIGTDRRVGPAFLFPGIGFGGSCFPKDVRALERLADEVGYEFPLIRAVHAVNDRQRRRLADKIRDHFGDLDGKRLALWGLAFKPRTDDVREAPALFLIEDLLGEGATIRAFDPEAMPNARKVLGDRIGYAPDAYAALDNADALVVVTEWNEFRFPDFERMRGRLARPVVFDGRNVYDPRAMRERGFVYHSIGRPDDPPASADGRPGRPTTR